MTLIGFVGTGQMAQALAGGISASDSGVSFVVADPSEDAIGAFKDRVGKASVKTVSKNADVFAEAEIVFLAVKPQYFMAAIESDLIVPAITGRDDAPLVVSIMAGISIAKIQFHTTVDNVIRVMPNTPCLVGAGASGMSCSDSVTEAQSAQVAKFMATTGIVLPVAENLLDAVTGLSGSGPAYIFEFIDALALGGVKCGLPRNVANELAAQTVFGAAKLAIESGEHPSVLRDRVTSPGGTTIAGLKALYDNGFQQAAISAVEAASNRSKELG
jgi:pyrroline-5-carboxylate reductase